MTQEFEVEYPDGKTFVLLRSKRPEKIERIKPNTLIRVSLFSGEDYTGIYNGMITDDCFQLIRTCNNEELEIIASSVNELWVEPTR